MKISIVIRSYNEARHIGKLLVGIAAQSQPPHEVELSPNLGDGRAGQAAAVAG